jgi:hypothetical protein
MTTQQLIEQVATHAIQTEGKLIVAMSKIEKITKLIIERFNKDGVDDINFPKKITFFAVVANIPAIVKLLRQIFEVLREPTPEIQIQQESLQPFLNAITENPETLNQPITQ